MEAVVAIFGSPPVWCGVFHWESNGLCCVSSNRHTGDPRGARGAFVLVVWFVVIYGVAGVRAVTVVVRSFLFR